MLERLSWDQPTRAGRRESAGDSVALWDLLGFIAWVLDHLPEPHQRLLRS